MTASGVCGQARSLGRRCYLRCEGAVRLRDGRRRPARRAGTAAHGRRRSALSSCGWTAARPDRVPADDPDCARRFWSDLLGAELTERSEAEGRGWQTLTGKPAVGIHERGTGPGDTVSLPYFTIADIDAALGQVKALGGSVIHSGSRWAICRDSEGSRSGWPSTPSPRSAGRRIRLRRAVGRRRPRDPRVARLSENAVSDPRSGNGPSRVVADCGCRPIPEVKLARFKVMVPTTSQFSDSLSPKDSSTLWSSLDREGSRRRDPVQLKRAIRRVRIRVLPCPSSASICRAIC